jgi:hypothetical protein
MIGAKFTALWAEGKSMTMEQAIQLALNNNNLKTKGN